MKLILVIVGVLAILALVQARPQEAENDNQEEAIEIPSEQQPDQEGEVNENPQIPQEKPHGRPHLKPPRTHFHPNRELQQQQPGQNEGQNPPRGPFGRPRPYRHSHFGPRPRPRPRPEPQPQPQPEREEDQDQNPDGIDNLEIEPVLLDKNEFSILNGSGNNNTVINEENADDEVVEGN